MQQIMRESDQASVAFGNDGAEGFERIEKAPPGCIRDSGGKRGPVEGQVALPQRLPRFALARSDRSDGEFARHRKRPQSRWNFSSWRCSALM